MAPSPVRTASTYLRTHSGDVVLRCKITLSGTYDLCHGLGMGLIEAGGVNPFAALNVSSAAAMNEAYARCDTAGNLIADRNFILRGAMEFRTLDVVGAAGTPPISATAEKHGRSETIDKDMEARC
ncbi:MAG: hypothetical protein OXQ29_13785 [Rhodospirillaceae bacterium]|nr:hypothetical protein [Rhodospirillaceae bacterium]